MWCSRRFGVCGAKHSHRFPGNTLTLTNLDTGKSITVVTTGSFHGQLEPDGSGFFMVTGPGPFLTNPITGEPGVWYSSGRFTATFDAEGNQCRPTSRAAR